MLRSIRISAALILAVLLSAPAFAGEKVTLVVLVAPNAKLAFTAIASAYTKSHPDVSFNSSFTGSKIIASELASGAQADVVIMAQPNVAGAGSAVENPVVIFNNRTAIGVNKSSSSKVTSPKDLIKPGIKIAAGTSGSTVAGFQDAAVAKMTAHYGKDFSSKYEANVIGRKTNTTTVADMVASGGADAAILYEADIDSSKMVMIKLSGEDEVIVPAVVSSVKSSLHPAQAKEFAAFVAGAEAAAILRSFHHDAVK